MRALACLLARDGACALRLLPQVCAKCALRMRMLYKDPRCPLCKQVNEEIVMVRPTPTGEMRCTSAGFAQEPKWPARVCRVRGWPLGHSPAL